MRKYQQQSQSRISLHWSLDEHIFPWCSFLMRGHDINPYSVLMEMFQFWDILIWQVHFWDPQYRPQLHLLQVLQQQMWIFLDVLIYGIPKTYNGTELTFVFCMTSISIIHQYNIGCIVKHTYVCCYFTMHYCWSKSIKLAASQLDCRVS